MGGHLETEQVAMQANIAAEQARYEVQRIQVCTLGRWVGTLGGWVGTLSGWVGTLDGWVGTLGGWVCTLG